MGGGERCGCEEVDVGVGRGCGWGGRCGCEEVGVGGELGVDVEVDVGGREVDVISKGVI